MVFVNEIKFRVLFLNQTYPKIMKKTILLVLFFLKTISIFSQTQRLEDVCQVFHLPDGKDTTTFIGWHSFSTKNLDNLLKINTPLYIAYGTEDGEVTIGLDYLPLDFIENGKRNLSLKAYVNHDHQFYELKKDTSGKVIDKIFQGDKVSQDFMDWLGRN